MFLLKNYSKYFFAKRVLGYRPDGELSHTYLVVRPDTPPEIVEKLNVVNDEWEKYHEGRSLFLFPGDELYPVEWLNQPEAK